MYKNAQGMIEVGLLAMLVAILSISVWAVFNNQKESLANFTKSGVTQQSVNLTELEKNPNDPRWNNRIPNKGIETAGGSSLLRMTPAAYNAILSNITYAQLNAVLKVKEGDKDLITLANELKDEIKAKDINNELNIPPQPITKEDINNETILTMTKILGAIETKKYAPTPTEIAYVKRVNDLVVLAKAAAAGSTETAGGLSGIDTKADEKVGISGVGDGGQK